MASQGTVIARVYTSDAFLPLPDAPVTFTRLLPSGERVLLALRYTDRSGLTAPVALETPDPSASQSPGASMPPFSTVDLQVTYPGYSSINAEGVQVFPGVETIQGLQLYPVTPISPGQTSVLPPSVQNL